METKNNDERIISSVSFMTFAQTYGGDIAVGMCRSEAGIQFPMVSFTNDGKKFTYVGFGKSLPQGLTLDEICEQYDDLEVVELAVDAETIERRVAKGMQVETFKICKRSENAWKRCNFFASIKK